MTEQTAEKQAEETAVVEQAPLIFSLAIDMNNGSFSMSYNARSEGQFRIILDALGQSKDSLNQRVYELVEQRVRAELSQNGEAAE